MVPNEMPKVAHRKRLQPLIKTPNRQMPKLIPPSQMILFLTRHSPLIEIDSPSPFDRILFPSFSTIYVFLTIHDSLQEMLGISVWYENVWAFDTGQSGECPPCFLGEGAVAWLEG